MASYFSFPCTALLLALILKSSAAISSPEDPNQINNQADQFSQTDNHQIFNFPGGLVSFNIRKQSDDIPEVKYGLTEPAIIDQGHHWRVVIGIGLQTLPGQYVAYIKHGIKGISGQHQKVFVEYFNYPYLEANAYQAQEFKALFIEHKSFSNIDFNNSQQPSLPLKLPLKGDWDNHFGHAININNEKTLLTPNSVSLSTSKLKPVVSPQNAIVSKIETSDDGSSSVFLDHGRGIYSILSGLSDLAVDEGDGIKTGAVIGKLRSNKGNSSNRESVKNTPRLIWQTVVNGEYVNPLLLAKFKL